MILGILISASLLSLILGGLAAYRQFKLGLGITGLADTCSWGLYVQSFFFLAATAAGLLTLLGAACLLTGQLPHGGVAGLALVLGCLLGAGILLLLDLGRPQLLFGLILQVAPKDSGLIEASMTQACSGVQASRQQTLNQNRNLMLDWKFWRKVRPNLQSPIFWDFIGFKLSGLLALIGLLGLAELCPQAWGALSLLVGLGFLAVHVHFMRLQVQSIAPAKTQDNSFNSAKLLAESLVSAAGLWLTAACFYAPDAVPLWQYNLLALGILVLVVQSLAAEPGWPPFSGCLSLKLKNAKLRQVTVLAKLNASLICMGESLFKSKLGKFSLLGLILICSFLHILPFLIGFLAMLVIFMSKAVNFKAKTVLPPPFDMFTAKPAYHPTIQEYLITFGGFGLAILCSLGLYGLFVCYP